MVDYKQKYLKYKAKYLALRGGVQGFDELAKDINLTDAHMDKDQLDVLDTHSGRIKAIEILLTKPSWMGIQNRDKQPNWYRDNPTFSSIVKDKEMLEKFLTEMKRAKASGEVKIEGETQPVKKGGALIKNYYTRYNLKYLTLRGGGYIELASEINITNQHINELGVKDRLSALIKGVEILLTNPSWIGIVNRSKQPNWYKDNSEFSTISKNTEYLKLFLKDMLNAQNTNSRVYDKNDGSDKATTTKAASDKAASDKAATDKAVATKAASDKAATDKAAADKAAATKAASDKAASDKAEADKAVVDKSSQSSQTSQTSQTPQTDRSKMTMKQRMVFDAKNKLEANKLAADKK